MFVCFLAFHVLLFTSAQAQQPKRHNCWDIDLMPPERGINIPTPYAIAPSDSGMLLVEMAKEYLGTPYHYGGRGPKAFDCAGFALYLYRHFGHHLPGWSGAQAHVGTEVSDTRNLQAGDLVFFGARHNTKYIGHTGIAIQTDPATGVFTFIHAATHGGVIISRSTEEYYKKRYITARRVFR